MLLRKGGGTIINAMAQVIECVSLRMLAELILSSQQKKLNSTPFICGITGASGAGKTTLSLDLQKILQQECRECRISVIQADNFIYSNTTLDSHNLMHRKGFPESFDIKTFERCLKNILDNHFPIEMPCYSQDIKDILPEKVVSIEKSHIYIIEGVNLFFKYEHFNALDYINFCIYLDTNRELVKARALKRFFEAYTKSKNEPTTYFEKFLGWSETDIYAYAENLWTTMDKELFKKHIEPYQSLANLVIKSYTLRT